MPTVAIVEGVKVQFFFDDHPPPHFHAQIGGAVAQIDIETLSVLQGQFASRQAASHFFRGRKTGATDCSGRGMRPQRDASPGELNERNRENGGS